MAREKQFKKNRNALLLTGGGARASYQVGVLKAIADMYPREHAIPFPILCGTSAGAINVTAIACYASCFRLGVKKLEHVWKRIHTNQVFCFDRGHLIKHLMLSLISGDPNESFALMSNDPLRHLLDNVIDYQRIDHSIVYGALDVLAITASSYTASESTTFFQGRSRHQEWRRARRVGRRAVIATEHLLASSALPFIFPPERVAGHFYGDGSVHQLSPLSPAIHLGANRILIVGLDTPDGPSPPAHTEQLTSSDVGGHLLSSIFADALNTDIENVNRINRLIKMLSEEQCNKENMTQIHTLQLLPSQNLDTLAMQHFRELPRNVRKTLEFLGTEEGQDSSITGFLMFENSYARQLIDLGYQDTVMRREELRDFLELEE